MGRLVLLCPSGVATNEKLPVTDGVRRRESYRLVASVFHDRHFVCPGIVEYYERLFAKRVWREGELRTVKDTRGNSIRDKLSRASVCDVDHLRKRRPDHRPSRGRRVHSESAKLRLPILT